MAHCRHPPKRKLGFNIVYEKLPKNYGGMNCWAARELKLPYPYPCKTILIDPNQSCKAINDTIRHEAIETVIMKGKLPYRKAHRLTTEIEKKLKLAYR